MRRYKVKAQADSTDRSGVISLRSIRASYLLASLAMGCVDLGPPPELEACRGQSCAAVPDAAGRTPAPQGDSSVSPRADAVPGLAVADAGIAPLDVAGPADRPGPDRAVVSDMTHPVVIVDAPSGPDDGPLSMVPPDASAKKSNGGVCTVAGDCNSGFCTDGVCCDGDCVGICRSCTVAATKGICTPIPDGTDPATECPAESGSTCGRLGSCNGAGACRLHPAGTACGSPACSGGVESAERQCNGIGLCPAASTRNCGVSELCQNARCTVNATPSVNAGLDQTKLTLGGKTNLAGSATDDGIPTPVQLSLSWSKISGPGTVTFDNPSSVRSPVAFSALGTYVLRLTASDGAASSQDDVTINVLGLDQGLAGHWRFDETSGSQAADSSGGNNQANLMGSPAWKSGRFNGAIDVSAGDADYGLVADPGDDRLDFGTGDFSVSLWMQTTQVPVVDVTYPEILNKWEYVPNGRLGYEIFTAFWAGKHQTSFKIWCAPDVLSVEVTDLNNGEWHHVVGRKTAAKIQIFADGVMKTEAFHAFGTLSAQAPLQFGGYAGAGWADFDGKIDDIRIYSRALTDSEIVALTSASP